MANLFRILCTKFCQNRLSFIGDMTKTFWLAYFFLGHGVNVYLVTCENSRLLVAMLA